MAAIKLAGIRSEQVVLYVSMIVVGMSMVSDIVSYEPVTNEVHPHDE